MRLSASPEKSKINLILFGAWVETPVFHIPEGHVGMFGYGSLMSRKFIDQWLLSKDHRGPYVSASLKGYRRSWSFAWPSEIPFPGPDGKCYRDYAIVDGRNVYPKNLHYLNIVEDPGSRVNGVMYTVPQSDLPEYDVYEMGYERFEVSELIQGHRVEGGPVYAYRALADFTKKPVSDCTENIIELRYWNLIREALDQWGEQFKAAYRNSTDPVDEMIVRDIQQELWIDPPLHRFEEFRKKYG